MNAIPKFSRFPSPLFRSPVWLVCLFACAELNVLLLLNTLFWLPWQIAACCLAMLESVYIHIYICVCACVLTLYKLLIIMSPSECHHDLHESFSLAWLGLALLCWVSGYHIYSIYISIYICCVYPWQLASGAVRLRALVMCRMSSSSTRCFRSFIAAFVAAGANPPDIFILHMSNAHTHTHTHRDRHTNCHW